MLTGNIKPFKFWQWLETWNLTVNGQHTYNVLIGMIDAHSTVHVYLCNDQVIGEFTCKHNGRGVSVKIVPSF